MTTLKPMRAETYADYVASSVAGYAQDNVAAGRWPIEGALERSRAEFEGLLPQGLATPDNHLFEIKASDDGVTVGYVWLAVVVNHGLRGAYVYDLEVLPQYRRQGHAKRALLALEPVAAALGLPTIGLHVFGHNPGAQALYQQLGYGVTGINMLKRLEPPQ
jgi:ribosomal protein S18 acetylase RimI-like enzyme